MGTDAARLESKGYALIARGHRLLARAAALRVNPIHSTPGDDLVAVSDLPLDRRTRIRLEREGLLPVTKLGRRKFTRRSALVALVEQPTGVAGGAATAGEERLAARPLEAPDPSAAAKEAYVALACAAKRRSA
jgi:hypothetical protein